VRALLRTLVLVAVGRAPRARGLGLGHACGRSLGLDLGRAGGRSRGLGLGRVGGRSRGLGAERILARVLWPLLLSAPVEMAVWTSPCVKG
jgi:hypothetical protein